MLSCVVTTRVRKGDHFAWLSLMYCDGLHGFELGLIKLVAGTLAPRPAGEITVTRETGVSALVNGGQRVGMVIVRKAVDIAIQKAKTSGMSVVGVTNYASATGALGVWGREIARAGLIGIVFSQVSQCNGSGTSCNGTRGKVLLFNLSHRLCSSFLCYDMCSAVP
jgi:hypothetical protein